GAPSPISQLSSGPARRYRPFADTAPRKRTSSLRKEAPSCPEMCSLDHSALVHHVHSGVREQSKGEPSCPSKFKASPRFFRSSTCQPPSVSTAMWSALRL